jgi:catechol 2,3-dioxygenase-like lactoylglutathione lyase family enzyme
MKKLALVLALVCAVPSSAQTAPLVLGVGCVGNTVSDVDRSVAFYTQVLHFAKASEQEFSGDALERAKGVFGARVRVVRLTLGNECLELTQYLASPGRSVPVDSRSNDRWFQHIAIIVRDMNQAYAWLRKHKVAHASTGPQRLPDWNPNAGGIKAFYFRDPDGHNLEILEFPAGKGDPRWRRPGTDLFLGIDHTAIVIGDTDDSLAFYRDLLGLVVQGESENYGIEQERLNNVFGARLRITSLKAASGPAIEFLQYLSPSDGRPIPLDTKSNDLVHWEIPIVVADLDTAWREFVRRRVKLVSPGPQAISAEQKEFQAKDPDGHAIVIRSRP